MGCGSSKEEAKEPTRPPAAAAQASAPAAGGNGDASPVVGPDGRQRVKSLSNYNKTKGGSMLFNVSQHKMLGEDVSAEFIDEQHILSPSKPDWKVGKAIKRAPDLKQPATIPIPIPESQGTLHDLSQPKTFLNGGGGANTQGARVGSGRVIVNLGYKTLQGRNPRPPHKPNQDALTIFIVDDNPHLVVFAVFDGHGPYGEHASQYMRAHLHNAMVSRPDLLKTNPREAFIRGLADVHSNFCSDATVRNGVDPVVSGTTCVGIMFEGKKLHIANVGDSRAIIGIENKDKHEIKVEALTDDHKPQRPDERARLEQSSALLLTEREVRGFGDDSKIYICREKGGDIVYGVLFTRSLGDLDAHNHLGVSAEPEMGERVLDDNDRFFILASDGVWDYMTNEEVMDVCTSAGDPLKAAEALAAEASERWDTRDADHRRDDITALILRVRLISPEDKEEFPPIDSPPAASE